ncbi:MAG: DinB family protein [Hymenobacteraceae bacterium]|nr:DinB family protein [Hymenobacteraceae bacterium]MDX5512556.1 DinB family protein [Hymenobacteraceae bacterium]
MNKIPKPAPGEYPQWYEHYFSQLADKDALQLLEEQLSELEEMLQAVSDEQAALAYAPGKWTLKELLVHMLDTERIMAYRALAISRGEAAALPGFDENSYAEQSQANERIFSEILEEYRLQRLSNLALFRSFSEEMLNRKGHANGQDVTVKAIIYVVAAHERHHLNIFKERYLKAVSEGVA